MMRQSAVTQSWSHFHSKNGIQHITKRCLSTSNEYCSLSLQHVLGLCLHVNNIVLDAMVLKCVFLGVLNAIVLEHRVSVRRPEYSEYLRQTSASNCTWTRELVGAWGSNPLTICFGTDLSCVGTYSWSNEQVVRLLLAEVGEVNA